MKRLTTPSIILATLMTVAMSFPGNILAQPLNDNGSTHTIHANGANQYEGSAQDFVIPANPAHNSVTFTVRGGDGGKAQAGTNNQCISNGGAGATATATFLIGNGIDDLAPGGTIRFIVGKHGENGDVGGNNGVAGGGGGGTAVLYRKTSTSDWDILVAAGGGGGAYQGIFLGICVDSQLGQGGRSSTSGGDGASSNGGGGGSGGGGGGGTPVSSGGGGKTANGGPDGNGGQKGLPAGGQGATSNQAGGWGFGGGGHGEGQSTGGGGGGGYSGGGAGNFGDNGGGGGSYVHPTYAINGTKTNGADGGGNSQNGYVQYKFVSTPIVWTGSLNKDWHNSQNWNLRVPTKNDLVNIDPNGNAPIVWSTAHARAVRVFNGGELTVGSDGTLKVYPRGLNAINNEGTITNIGTIDISRFNGYSNFTGINNSGGSFTNQFGGTINISGMDWHGIRNLNSGTVTNLAGGEINIDQTTIHGISNNSGTFTNIGNIQIAQVAAISSSGILNQATFLNQAGGTITIGSASHQVTRHGFENDPGGACTNHGDITIRNTGLDNISNQGIYTNATQGSLILDEATESCIDNQDQFENDGIITVGGSAGPVLDGIINRDIFNNNNSGSINIMNAGQAGIFSYIGQFTNQGLIKIGQNGTIGLHAIFNGQGSSQLFSNSTCNAQVHIFDKNIQDEANTFTNTGVVLQQSNVTSDISTNNGVILYNTGVFNVDAGDAPILVNGTLEDRKVWTACTGNGWGNPLNWYPAGSTQNTDQVVIYPIGTNPLIPGPVTGQAKSVLVDDSASLTNNGTLNVTDGPFVIESGSTVSGNGTYNLSGVFGLYGGTFNADNSTVRMTGTESKNMGNDPVSFYNLVIDKSPDAYVGILAEVTVTNDLTVNSGDLEIFGFLGGSVTCPKLWLPDGSDLLNSGSLTLTTGALWIQTGASARGNGDYNLNQNLILDGGTFTAGTSTVNMLGNTNSSISPDSISLYNLVVSKPATNKVTMLNVTVTNDLQVTSGDITVLNNYSLTTPRLHLGNGSDLVNDGIVTITSDSLWIQSGASAQGNGEYELAGDFAMDIGGTFSPGTSTVRFTGPVNQSIYSHPLDFHTLIIEKEVGTKVNLHSDVNVNNNFNFPSGEVEIMNGRSFTSRSFTVPATSRLINNGDITIMN